MRVALLQLALNPKSRAGTIQSLLAGIKRAAEATPAPDIIVLPGACDTGGVTPRGDCAEAARQSTREMIATQAREWGVFIAAGLHKYAGDRLVPWAVLFDPDGDIVAQSSAALRTGEAGDKTAVEVWPSPVGNIGVVDPSSVESITDRLAAVQDAFLAMPAKTADLTQRSDSLATFLGNCLPTKADIYWGVVSPAADATMGRCGDGATTFLCDPRGCVTASAETAEETIIRAEIPLALVTTKVEENACFRGRQTD